MIELMWKKKRRTSRTKAPKEALSIEQTSSITSCIARIKKNAKNNDKFYTIIPDYVYCYIFDTGINAKVEVLNKNLPGNKFWVEISRCE